MHQIILEVSETHRNTFRLLRRGLHTHRQSISVHILARLSKYMGESISQHLLGPHAPNFLEVSQTHRNIFRLLGRCWCTHSWEQWDWITGPSWANTWGSGEVNISASIRAPCTKVFWRFLRHIGTFLDLLGRCWHTNGWSISYLIIWAKLSKYMGVLGSQYLSIY